MTKPAARYGPHVSLPPPVALLAALVLATAALMTASIAPAMGSHNADREWIELPANGYDHYVRWNTDSTIGQSGAWFTAVATSAGTWNVVGTELLFAKATSSIRVTLDRGVLTGVYEGKAGATFLTVLGDRIDNAWIRFNTAPAPAGGCSSLTWYTGSSTTVPACQLDARTYALHEWGHAISLRHSGYTADVMYTFSPIGSAKRVLTTHDKDGIRWFY